MDIFIQPYAFGKNENGNIVYDWNKSYENVIGIFANLKVTSIIVVKVYFENRRYDIADEWIIKNICDLDLGITKVKEFSNQYNVQHFLGNKMGNNLYTGTTRRGNFSKDIIFGWETTEFDVENMFFLTQSRYLKSMKFKQELESIWYEEIDSFDLEKCLENKKIYPRLFAFFHVLAGVKTSCNYSFFKVPDCIVDENGKIIIHDEDEKKIRQAFEMICRHNKPENLVDKQGRFDHYRKWKVESWLLHQLSNVDETKIESWIIQHKSEVEIENSRYQ